MIARGKRKPTGIDVVGYLKAESGVGEGARLLISALQAADIPYSTFIERAPALREQHPFESNEVPLGHSAVVLAINADELPRRISSLPRSLLRHARRIAMWAWEVEEFPVHLAASSSHVDEIWVNSRHEFDAIAPVVDVPVQVFPLPIPLLEVGPGARLAAGFGGRFTFLFCFDAYSVFERKNPVAAVRAFRAAFAPDEGPLLVIKSVNGHAFPEKMAEVQAAIGDRPDIELRDGYVSAEQQRAMIGSCDAYVSLHRAEGFGLTLAEAMASGRPVIATGYSGNLEFMTHANSWLVSWEHGTVPLGCDPYPSGCAWAEPDVDDAAACMRTVVADRAEVERRKSQARADLLRCHSPYSRASFLRRRLAAVTSL